MILIIPDIHEEIITLERVLAKYSHIKKKISLGDWYDSFNYCSVSHVEETALLHKDFIQNPDHICLFGNHDIQYAFPDTEGLFCSGWYAFKQNVIERNMRDMWQYVKLFHWETVNNREWVFSHAGFHPGHCHPIHGFNRERATVICDQALFDVKYEKKIDPVLAVGYRRGGRRQEKHGGCTWMDWRDFEPIQGINQVVGHTRNQLVREHHVENSENWCIDTGFENVAILDDDGKITIESVY